jgi:CTP synthase (UTP-ammonia lyase)
MLCENCQTQTATVHLTVIVEGRQSTRNYCPACYNAATSAPAALAEMMRKAATGDSGSHGSESQTQVEYTDSHDRKPVRVALVGDFNREVLAHRAIDLCFGLAQTRGDSQIEGSWIPTEAIMAGDLNILTSYHGIWVVPASPYRNTAGALWAIEYARTKRIPFLGTCGGFQHALLEYARNVLGLKDADHAELNPETKSPLLHRMQCLLVEQKQKVIVKGGEKFGKAYGADEGLEGYHCSFGLNPQYEHLLADGELEIVARSEDGEVRAVELRGHPFFIGTLFQPERRALEGEMHPLVRGFFRACLPSK